MSEKIYIYGLYDPFTKELRYIGKTNNINKRLWTHIRNAERGQKTYKSDWIRSVLDRGERPLADIIQETTEEGWQEDEKFCIAEAKAKGARLTNLTEGGDGLVNFNHSEKTKKKISEHNKKSGRVPPNWKDRKQSPEHIKKRVKARKRNGTYKHSQETKDLISQKNTGKNLGNTHTLGHKHTDEWKERMSQANSGEDNPFYGRQHTEESRRKISEGKKGQRPSEEIRAKLSKAQLARAHRGRVEHVARIAIPYDEVLALSDDQQVKEIYRLYIKGEMTKREIAEHLGYSGTGGRFYKKLSDAIKAIPVIDPEVTK